MKKITLLSKVASVLLLFSMLCNHSVSARENTTYFAVPANPPTLTAVTITPVCVGKKATIVLAGLIPNSTGVATYSVNGVTRTVTGTANSSGVFTFLSQTLTLTANGSVVTVLKLKDSNTQLETTFTGKTATIVVSPYPTLTSISVSPVCAGSSAIVTLTGLVPNSDGTAFYKIGSQTASQFGTADATGTFTINTLNLPASAHNLNIEIIKIINNSGCETIFTGKIATLVVRALPSVSLSNYGPYCEGSNVSLSVSGATTYSWNGPLSFSSSDKNPSFVASVTASGSYTVIATDDNGCVNTASTDVVVNPLPVVEITGSTAVCEGNSFNLTATGGATYAWRGAVGSSNGASSSRYTASTATINRDINGVNHYHRAGEYTVSATDAKGCVNTASQTISVSPRLTLNTIPVIPPACEGSSFTINSIATITNVNRTNSWPYFALSAGNANDISYAWSGPNGFTSSSSNASVSNASMDSAGTYSLTIIGPGGCTKSADRNITINPLPTIELAASAAVCVGSDITLTATSNGTILSWFRNGTFLAFGSSYTISSADMSDAGSYTFRARSNNLCVVEQSIDVTVNAVPTLLEIMIAPVCSGSSATIVLTGLLPTTNGIATYSINGGTPQIESGISDGNGRFSFNTPTLGMGQNNYTVEILSITNIETGCFTNFTGKTAILKVNPNPSLSTIETSPICSGSPATILLSGLLPNTNGTATYTINGGITQFQASGVSSSQGTFSFQTDPLPAAANGFTINIIKIRNVDTSCETSFTNKTVTLIVNASPTLAAITIAPIVRNNKATVVLSGLLKNQLGTATYTVNGGSEQQASGTSTSAGTFSFQTPTLGVAQNGWIVRIISIKNNDNLCETAFSNMQAPLSVTNSLRSENTPTVADNEVIAPTFGLQNQAKIDIVLYPNPASDVLNIETALEVQSVIMLNINGQIVLSSNQKQVNVSALPAGIYMVQIKDAADNVTTKKIIIK